MSYKSLIDTLNYFDKIGIKIQAYTINKSKKGILYNITIFF